MSSHYLREPPSSSLRSRLFLENKGEASNDAYDRRPGPPIVQAPIEFGNENPGLPVNGYVTSGLRGRSAIYRMSRSPYFKVTISMYIMSDSYNFQFFKSRFALQQPRKYNIDYQTYLGMFVNVTKIVVSWKYVVANPLYIIIIPNKC